MKLGELMIQRSEIQKRMSSLRERLKKNAMVQEDGQPVEAPEPMIRQMEESTVELAKVVKAINRVNQQTVVDGEQTISELLVDRDMLVRRHSILNDLVAAASNTDKDSLFGRVRHSELRWIPTVDVAELRTKLDSLSKQINSINNKLQSVNWTTEVSL